jgi:integrase
MAVSQRLGDCRQLRIPDGVAMPLGILQAVRVVRRDFGHRPLSCARPLLVAVPRQGSTATGSLSDRTLLYMQTRRRATPQTICAGQREQAAAGLRPPRWHDLRHTFGTATAAAGVPMRTLQEWMGHRDIETTQLYADYAPRSRDAELVAAAFSRDDNLVGSGLSRRRSLYA